MDPTKKICPHPRAKEKPQQERWKGEIAFRSKSHTHQRWSEGSNKTLCAPGPRDPTRGWARPAFECLSISWEGKVSSGLLQGQVLWLKQTWEAWQLSPNIKPPSRRTTNWRTITPKKFLHCCGSSRVHKRVPNLGIWQTDWESQGIWLWRPVGFDDRTYTGLGKQILGEYTQNLVCTRNPEERSSNPTRDWARLACECPGVFNGGVGRQWPARESGALNTTVLA